MKLKPQRYQDPEDLIDKLWAYGHNFGRRGPCLHLQSNDAGPIEPSLMMNGENLPTLQVPPCFTLEQWLEIQEQPQ